MSGPLPALIDVNATIGRLPNAQVGGDAADLVASMDRLGIADAVVSHLESWRHSAAAGNARVLRDVRGRGRLHPCWVVLPEGTEELPAPQELTSRAVEAGVVAARALPKDHGWLLTSPEGIALGHALTAARLPLLIDADQTCWATLDSLAGACPDLDLVVCRVGYRGSRTFVPVLARRPRIHLDLSYLGGHNALEWFVERFGVGRLMFGTGAPTVDPAGPVARLAWSGLSDEEVHVAGRVNAQRLFGIGAPHG